VIVYFPSGVSVRAEVARTPAEIELGLMYRKSVPEGTGMLFDMGQTGMYRFWMKNTLVPLDMIFLDAAGVIVGIVANAKPLDPTMCGVQSTSRYVLEVPDGWAARQRVAVGQRATMVRAPR
jgi:uncharacterized protein